MAFLKSLDERLAATGAARSFRIGAALYEKKFGYDIQSGYDAAGLYERAKQ